MSYIVGTKSTSIHIEVSSCGLTDAMCVRKIVSTMLIGIKRIPCDNCRPQTSTSDLQVCDVGLGF